MFKGFREFILRGNVIDLAVAVVVATAFSALIGAFTEGLIKPIIGLVLGGGVDAGQWVINGQVIDFTLMINAAITFLITMLVLYYAFVVPMNAYRNRTAPEDEDGDDRTPDQRLLEEIRDLLREQRGSGTSA